MVAFLGSIGTAFTGYLSQSNFDAQWISTQAKDGLNSVGIGAWFNVLEPRPDAAVARRAAAVRRRRPGRCCTSSWSAATASCPPLDAEPTAVSQPWRPRRPRPRPSTPRRAPRPHPGLALVPDPASTTWSRSSSSPSLVVVLLTVGLAAVFSSPDEKAITMRDWATAAPADVVATATGELAGTTTSATYGPPYNSNATGQKLGPLPLQKWARGAPAGRLRPGPRAGTAGRLAPATPRLTTALAAWNRAGAQQRTAWATALRRRPRQGPRRQPGQGGGRRLRAGAGHGRQLPAARAQRRPRGRPHVRPAASTAATRPARCCCSADGAYLEDQARARNLGGDQWGMMNETGNYPGQPWMWLYTFWYQVPPFSTSDNADALVWGLMMVLSLGAGARSVHPRPALDPAVDPVAPARSGATTTDSTHATVRDAPTPRAERALGPWCAAPAAERIAS